MFTLNTSRSEIQLTQRCPRKRYLHSFYPNGTATPGIVAKHVAVPLAFGSGQHLGLQRLLEGADVEDAIAEARQAYFDQVRDGLQDVASTAQAYTLAEQAALLEQMTR